MLLRKNGDVVQTEKVSEGIAGYAGISAPETPKYLLANNFLAEYFKPSEAGQEYTYKRFIEQKTIFTENKADEEKLENAFNCFLHRYLGEEAIQKENTRLMNQKRKESTHYYFPLIPEMLTEGKTNLRHILYHLQRLDSGFEYEKMQEKLGNYIFRDSSGINYILKILFEYKEEDPASERQWYKEETETPSEYWSLMELKGEKTLTALGRKLTAIGKCLNEDLDRLLTHDYFLTMDFYRRYQYLSVLLTSYVLQYILARKDGTAVMLCKGSSQDVRLTGPIHRACCNNYEDIRNLFPTLLKRQYETAARRLTGENSELQILLKDGEILINEKLFLDFAAEMTGRKTRNAIEYEKLVNAFELTEEEEKRISVEDFVLRYIELTGSKRGSVLTKLSSVLSTSGKQIGMVYPMNNARQKYFAMSESLAEFYVRLYLAGVGQQYDYLDNFLRHLEQRYRIIIVKSGESERHLKSIKPNLSAQEFAKNKAAFIDTLGSANCLVKLSDSGYVITLPEMKGDFQLI